MTFEDRGWEYDGIYDYLEDYLIAYKKETGFEPQDESGDYTEDYLIWIEECL